jgi:hypothetical protein
MSAYPDVINLTNQVRERVSFRRFARLARERRGQIRATIQFPVLGTPGFGSVIIEYERGAFEVDRDALPNRPALKRRASR